MNVAKVTSVKNRMSETIIIVKCLLNMKYILLAAKKKKMQFYDLVSFYGFKDIRIYSL